MENTFGGFLKEKRVENNLTQKELAKMLFVSESAVSKWEKDVARPDITLLPKLAAILGVSEHEIITASIDTQARAEKAQARRWRNLSTTWSLFFYIAYAVALIPCFICNLAIQKTLSWFWIVLSALLLAFTFTNLPKLLKKHKLILLPLSSYAALCLLLGVSCLYVQGNWFFIPVFSVFLGLAIVFVPIYIAKYEIFKKIRKYGDFVSVAVDFIVLQILLIVIESYAMANYAVNPWYFRRGLPISFILYLILNLFLSVRFLKINRLLKTSVILYLFNFFSYIVLPFIKVGNPETQKELSDFNIFKADLSTWSVATIEQNVHCIVFLSVLAVATAFLIAGLIVHYRRKKTAQKGNG